MASQVALGAKNEPPMGRSMTATSKKAMEAMMGQQAAAAALAAGPPPSVAIPPPPSVAIPSVPTAGGAAAAGGGQLTRSPTMEPARPAAGSSRVRSRGDDGIDCEAWVRVELTPIAFTTLVRSHSAGSRCQRRASWRRADCGAR